MKRAALFLVIAILIAALLCACTTEGDTDMENTVKETVTFINDAQDADIWILPDTEANRKTTVWGAASASQVAKGECRVTELCEPGDKGLYLLRMIDTDSFYYAASGIKLQADDTLRIDASDPYAVVLEVTDVNGNLRDTYEVFSARL